MQNVTCIIRRTKVSLFSHLIFTVLIKHSKKKSPPSSASVASVFKTSTQMVKMNDEELVIFIFPQSTVFSPTKTRARKMNCCILYCQNLSTSKSLLVCNRMHVRACTMLHVCSETRCRFSSKPGGIVASCSTALSAQINLLFQIYLLFHNGGEQCLRGCWPYV